MRPLRLTLTAFGPYAGTETVDFDALVNLGLFVVAGNNGAGKTTIFDALHYSLFGTLPGRRASYVRLRSDHAPVDVECSVVFDFAAHGAHWRVERSPKQLRPKRRGSGMTEVERQATLYRVEADQPIAVANRIGEVDEKCRELVGLSGKQFERVALLPQGEFSRVLRESSTDRRELLRALFSSEVFGDATSWLSERAAEATAADQAEFARLDQRVTRIADELGSLIDTPIDPVAVTLAACISELRDGQEQTLRREVAELERKAEAATTAHHAASEQHQRILHRDRVQANFDQHRKHADQNGRDLHRLQQARAAVPVVSQARTAIQQHERVTTTRDQITTLRARTDRALAAAGMPVLTSTSDIALTECVQAINHHASLLAARRDAEQTVVDLTTTTNRLRGDLRRLDNAMATLGEDLRVTQSQCRQLVLEHEQLTQSPDAARCQAVHEVCSQALARRRELDELDDQQQQAGERVAQQALEIDRLQRAHDEAQTAQLNHVQLDRDAQKKADALEDLERRRRAARAFIAATTRLHHLRAAFEQANTVANRHWDAFIAGTAARVAEALVDDQPCPVCGSGEHPRPAQPPSSDLLSTEHDVATARAAAQELRDAQREVELQIEALRSVDPDVATLSLDVLDDEIMAATNAALHTRTLADESFQSASQASQLSRALKEARDEAALHRDLTREIDERRNQLVGALGSVANEPIDDVAERARHAALAVADAHNRTERLEELQRQLEHGEQTLKTLGLRQLADDKERASLLDQLDERQHFLDQAIASCGELDTQLAQPVDADALSSTRPNGSSPDASLDFDDKIHAAHAALDRLSELRTAVALHVDAVDADRKARSLLAERLGQSPFDAVELATRCFVEPPVIEQLEAQTTAYATTTDQLTGQLRELADLPDIAPDVDSLATTAHDAVAAHAELNKSLIMFVSHLDRFSAELTAVEHERARLENGDPATRRLERVAALVKGDNERNTSLENWVLGAHLRDVVELANVRLARSTHQRFQLCVLDDGENRRGTWGLDLGVEDTVTGTRRPTAGLSGGELFQASLALALGLADAVMNQSAGVRIDALFIDEGFGSLDETSVERAIDLLDELRDRGAMVGVITHVPALLDALPVGVNVVVRSDGHGSTIEQRRLAA